MSSGASRFARGFLLATFGAAALLKTKHFLLDESWADALPLVRSTAAMTWLVLAEFATAALLATQWWRVACWGVIGILLAGNAAFAHAVLADALPSCGCFGGTQISPRSHAALTLGIFMLAAYVLDRDGARTDPKRDLVHDRASIHTP